MDALIMVISARGRTSKRGYGSADTFHLSEAGKRTLCGLDATNYLRMGMAEHGDLQSSNLCGRCKAHLSPATPTQQKE